VRIVAGIRQEHGSEWAAIESVASTLGIGTVQTLHNWIRKVHVDSGAAVRRDDLRRSHASRKLGHAIENSSVPTRV
jgi:transposase-like protein